MRERAAPDEPGRRRAADLLLRFLAWRLEALDVTALFGDDDVIEDTATGRALLAKGEARGEARGELKGQRALLARQLVTRFGPLPADVAARLEAATADDLARFAERVLTASDLAGVFGA